MIKLPSAFAPARKGPKKPPKPLKYPTIFNTADVAVITKMDLAEAVEFDLDAARANIQSVRPGMHTIQLSVKSGEGVDGYLKFLQDYPVNPVK